VSISYGSPSDLPTILDLLRNQVVNVVPFATDRVFASLSEPHHFDWASSDAFLCITPKSGTLESFAGPGRYSSRYQVKFQVSLFARDNADQEFRDNRTINDRIKGVVSLYGGVLNALHGFTGTSSGSGSSVFCQPCQIESFEIEPRRLSDTPWVKISSILNVLYVPILSPQS
jgi:hypothetical protein